MKELFERGCKVLDFGSRIERGAGGSQRWLAWPAFAWRVVAPRPKDRPLNVFEQAVLLLVRAGERTAVGQAELLGLNPQLTALIAVQFQARRWIDQDGAPTAQGLLTLESDAPDDGELVSGYVFQDPVSLDLWPRFVETLSFAEVDYLRQDGFPTLLRGSVGHPKREKLYVALPHDAPLPSQPNVVEIITALRRNGRGRRRFSQSELTMGHEDCWEGGDVGTLSQAVVDRIDFIEPDPLPCFLLSRVYFPQSEAIEAGWRACDPFGEGDSLFLRQRIEERFEHDKRLEDLIAQMVGVERMEVCRNLGGLLERLEAAACQSVEHELTLGIQQFESLQQRLVAMERFWAESVDAGQKYPDDKLEEVLSRAQKALEHLFYLIFRNHRNPSNVRRLSLDSAGRKFNAEVFDHSAQTCGFFTPLPKSLRMVKGGKVIPAIEHGRASLRPLILAALLAAEGSPVHPLRRAASRDPQLLVRLNELAGLRDRTAHDNSAPVRLDDVARQRETAYDAVSLLLDLPRRK